MYLKILLLGIFFLGFMYPLSLKAQDQSNVPPRVVVSLKPIHSLVAGVMGSRGSPLLLVSGNSSEHGYHLKPSDAQNLQNADLIFWIGNDMETYLEKSIQALQKSAVIITLSKIPEINLLPIRGDLHFERYEDIRENISHSHSSKYNLHIWLDPRNALTITDTIITELSKIDPIYGSIYQENGSRLKRKLILLDQELSKKLEPAKGKPFIVTHDAYQYLEHRYGLRAVGAITLSPEQSPSVSRLSKLRTKIKQLGAVCVFSEPHLKPSLLQAVINETEAKTETLDPLGGQIDAGSELYFNLMRSNAQALAQCLS
ncbi:MAG: zinc ABC transporter substrate-binding protein [Alphaproteobacteria bacterium]